MERSRRNVGGLKRPGEVKQIDKHGLILLSMGDEGKGEDLLQEPWGSMIKIDGVNGPTRR